MINKNKHVSWFALTTILATSFALFSHHQNLGLKAQIAELESRRPYIVHLVDSSGGKMLGQVTDKMFMHDIYTITIGQNHHFRVTKEQFDNIKVGDPAPEFLQQKGVQ